MGVTVRNISVAVAVVVLAAVAASSGAASSVRTYATHGTLPLRTSVDDPFTLTGAQRATGFLKARAAGASYVRIIVSWNVIAPSARPAGFDPADPTSHGYDWSWYDSTIGSAEKADLTPILDIARAPAWALAKSHGKRINTPTVASLGQFAKALALHYDGKHGAPPAHVFQRPGLPGDG